MKKKYIELQCDQETQNRLTQWCLDFGYDLRVNYYGHQQAISRFNFHTTVMYSSNEFKMKNENKKIFPIRAKAVDIQMLGPMNNIPALIIESKTIQFLHWKYKKLGLKYDWPIYVPHISVSYAENSPFYAKNILPDFDIVYDRLNIEDVV